MMNNICTQTKLISSLYKENIEALRLYLMHYTADRMKAEDMAQDVFIKLMNMGDMLSEERAKGLLFSVAKNMIIDDARHESFVRKATDQYAQTASQFYQDSDPLECREIAEAESSKLRALPRQMAEVYRLTRFEGKTSAELAEQMHLSKRTVEYHLFMARKEIRSAVKQAIGF